MTCDVILCTFVGVSLLCCIRMSTDVSDSSMSDSSQSCHELSEASEEELDFVSKLLPSSPPYLFAGLGTQYYVTTVPRDIFGRAMPGTYFRAESTYFKREKDDSRDILTAFKYWRLFPDISNYEKQKKKCHVICALKSLQYSLCDSRKYPYPSHGWFLRLDPPPHPLGISVPEGSCITPPPPRNFLFSFSWS